MTTSHQNLCRLVCVAACLFSISACATYRGAAIEGRVVDAETQQPVKDVVVVVEWILEAKWALHPQTLGRLLLQETVTDEQGHYRFPPWGPLRAQEGVIDRSAPRLNFYKRGYKFTALSNCCDYEPPYVDLPDPLISVWDRKTIELPPFKSKLTWEDYSTEVIEASDLYSLDETKCDWQQMPRMTSELMKRRQDYLKEGVVTSLPYRSLLYRNAKCADPEQFLEEYLK